MDTTIIGRERNLDTRAKPLLELDLAGLRKSTNFTDKQNPYLLNGYAVSSQHLFDLYNLST